MINEVTNTARKNNPDMDVAFYRGHEIRPNVDQVREEQTHLEKEQDKISKAKES